MKLLTVAFVVRPTVPNGNGRYPNGVVRLTVSLALTVAFVVRLTVALKSGYFPVQVTRTFDAG